MNTVEVTIIIKPIYGRTRHQPRDLSEASTGERKHINTEEVGDQKQIIIIILLLLICNLLQLVEVMFRFGQGSSQAHKSSTISQDIVLILILIWLYVCFYRIR
jgi:hypothetical protein